MTRVALLVGLITIAVGVIEAFPAIDEEYDTEWQTIDQGIEDVGQRDVDDQDDKLGLLDELHQENWIPINLDLKEFPKAIVEKRRNRIPLEWKDLKKNDKPITQKIIPDRLKMFFTRMKPKLSDKMKLLLNY